MRDRIVNFVKHEPVRCAIDLRGLALCMRNAQASVNGLDQVRDFHSLPEAIQNHWLDEAENWAKSKFNLERDKINVSA